ncbi:dethiobiotin synthase [Helicobacter sp. 23-1044]
MILFIAGTGSGVGKTTIAMRLNALLMQRGFHIISSKPIEVGAESASNTIAKTIAESASKSIAESPAESTSKSIAESASKNIADSALHAQNQSFPLNVDEICFYRFNALASPFVADKENAIDLVALKEKIFDLKRQCDILVVEGVGGLLVPIKRDYFVIDLIKDLGALCVLVSTDKLGCINEILLHNEALNSRRIRFINAINLFDKLKFFKVSYPFLKHLKNIFVFQTQESDLCEFIAQRVKKTEGEYEYIL